MPTLTKSPLFTNLTDLHSQLKENGVFSARYLNLKGDAGLSKVIYNFSSIDSGDEDELDTVIAAYPDDSYNGPNAKPLKIQTTDATVTIIATIHIPVSSVIRVSAIVLACKTDFTQRAAFEYWGLFYNSGSGAAIQGAVKDNGSMTSNANYLVGLIASGDEVRVTVKGDTSQTVDWKASIDTIEIS